MAAVLPLFQMFLCHGQFPVNFCRGWGAVNQKNRGALAKVGLA